MYPAKLLREYSGKNYVDPLLTQNIKKLMDKIESSDRIINL